VKIYTHDRAKILTGPKPAKPTLLKYPSGADHVLLPNGQQLRRTPKDRTESGKARRKREKAARQYTRALRPPHPSPSV